jgi:hypothetical protein
MKMTVFWDVAPCSLVEDSSRNKNSGAMSPPPKKTNADFRVFCKILKLSFLHRMTTFLKQICVRNAMEENKRM